MKNTYKLVWSDEALNNLRGIVTYLENNWTRKEIKKFAKLLDQKLQLIERNPFLFAETQESPGLRKSVISKQTSTSIYYRVIDFEIRIITLFDNRQNPNTLNDFHGTLKS